MVFLEKFILPDAEAEYKIARKKRIENATAAGYDSAPADFGYLDNGYPCGLFLLKELTEVDFDRVTIIYGGNGSGKSTLLNLLANKLKLKRLSPFNDSELFSLYTDICKCVLGFNDEGEPQKIPEKSMIITSDDVFDYMLAARTVRK